MDDATGRTSRVIRLARHLELVRREILAARELDLWEYDVLAALRSAMPPYELSPSALVDETLVASGTMTNRVDRLSRRGYVTREPDPADRRGVLVRLTVAVARRSTPSLPNSPKPKPRSGAARRAQERSTRRRRARTVGEPRRVAAASAQRQPQSPSGLTAGRLWSRRQAIRPRVANATRAVPAVARRAQRP